MLEDVSIEFEADMICRISRPGQGGSGVLHSLQVEHLSAALSGGDSTTVFSGTYRALQRIPVAGIPPVATCPVVWLCAVVRVRSFSYVNASDVGMGKFRFCLARVREIKRVTLSM